MKTFAKRLAALALMTGLIGMTQQALAQNLGEIRGKIIEKETNEPMIGVSVWVDVNGVPQGVLTDLDGKFVIKPLNPGKYTLYASMVGKNKIGQQMEVLPNQISYAPDLFMEDSTLTEVVVSAYKDPLINPEQTSVTTVRYKEIQHSPNLRNIQALSSSMTADFQVVNGQSYVRGGRSDASIYFVDGVKCRDGNINIPGVAIGSLSVYTGGVPAKYGDVTSGVIIVETKSYFDLYNDYINSQQTAGATGQ